MWQVNFIKYKEGTPEATEYHPHPLVKASLSLLNRFTSIVRRYKEHKVLCWQSFPPVANRFIKCAGFFFCCFSVYLLPCCHASCCIPRRQAPLICVLQCTTLVCVLQKAPPDNRCVKQGGFLNSVSEKRACFRFSQFLSNNICIFALNDLRMNTSISGTDFRETEQSSQEKYYYLYCILSC